MNIKTINLTGAETAVKVGGGNAEIRNNGTATIYASATSGIVAGADGVVSIPAGTSVTVTDTHGTVYILGTGSVEVVGKDWVAPVFKSALGGGGGVTEGAVFITLADFTALIESGKDNKTATYYITDLGDNDGVLLAFAAEFSPNSIVAEVVEQ